MNRPSSPAAPEGGAPGAAFVGRAGELARLTDALARPPAVLLVEGEAGSGKSRLVAEAVRALGGTSGGDTAPRRPVLLGRCHPLREPEPFGPVVDALRDAAALLPPPAELPPSTGALRLVLPDLAAQLPAVPPDGGTLLSARRLLAQGVRALLTALDAPVLVVEDLQWADDATLDLLVRLARDLPPRLALVLTYRPEELPPGAPAPGAVFRPAPDPTGGQGDVHAPVRLERLEPLDETAVAALARSVLGPAATPDLARVLHERSEGLPLAVEEDLHTLAEHTTAERTAAGRAPTDAALAERAPADRAGASAARTATGDPAAVLAAADIPRGLRDAVTQRLARLGGDGTAVVAAAAVLGAPADEALLTAVAGLDAEAGADGLTEALHAAVLRETAPDRYAFRSPAARQVAQGRIAGPRRRVLHQRAAAALGTREPRPLARIAEHTLAMGDRPAWQDLAQAAADQAAALGDPGGARRMLRGLLDEPDLDPRRRGRAALALARLAADDVDPAASVQVLSGMVADPRLPVADRGEIRLALGFLMAVHSGNRAGFDRIRESLEELEERPVRAARAMVAIAMDERDGAGRRAGEWLARAEGLLAANPDEDVSAAVRATTLTFQARDADPAVWDRLDELPRDSERPEVMRQTTRALYNAGEIAIELGYDRRSANLLEESRRLARLTGIPYLECYSRLALIRLDMLAGRWDLVEPRFARLGAEFDDLAMAGAERSLLFGRLAAGRGRLALAREELEIAARFGQRESQVTVALRAAAGLGGLQLLEGDTAGAAGTVGPALATARQADAWARTADLLPVAVEALLATGGRAEAAGVVEEATESLTDRDAPAVTAALHLARGLLLDADGDPGAAEAFTRARDHWQDIGRPYEAARADERIAAALAARDRARAAERMTAAERVYLELGATTDTARCRKLRRDLDLGGIGSPGRRGYGKRLSPRERQVAELLAQGTGNQDIAQALFLSPRTVEHHVANVLAKLGTGRAGTAQALARADAEDPAGGGGA
ncbi:regulatory protein, luxR family [Streptomyces sp. TLI_053]|uniref:helix-turn-helix transcriptional regulator n=1 Tax=Streptomyces sp. TLI_053 TaxID=1855352 RepID=UPI00087B2F51|nr:LuxR family transcriptional regulator [Streptomyces sp. TLI_053]SDT82876.1 regulatory protein, luxR family [Streptomyces sp. TLI_053]